MIYIILYIIFHLVCGYLFACACIAGWNEEYPTQTIKNWRKDFSQSLSIGLIGGPISLIVVFFYTGFFQYGFIWWKSKED